MSTEQQTQEKPEVITIQEAGDGSAVVELPDSIPSPDSEKAASSEEHSEGSDEADDAARQAEMASGGEIDAEAEALREAKRLKRQKRKEYHRQVSNEKDLKLDLLTRQNQELLERMAVLEKKAQGTDLARLKIGRAHV